MLSLQVLHELSNASAGEQKKISTFLSPALSGLAFHFYYTSIANTNMMDYTMISSIVPYLLPDLIMIV